MASGANVVRFPVERRAAPSVSLLQEIAPDCREVRQAIEGLRLDVEIDVIFDNADRGMAERILDESPAEPGKRRSAVLYEMLAPVVKRATELCVRCNKTRDEAEAAWLRLMRAKAEGGYWLEPLESRARSLAVAGAEQMVEAYIACQEASGAGRAIRLALNGEAWYPFEAQAEAEALFFGEQGRPGG